MIRRAAGGALLVLAVALAGLPALTWYSAPPPASPTSASGFAGAGELWLLPALALLIALAGARMLSAPLGPGGVVARWAGPLSLTAGALALGFAIWACVDPATVLTVTLPTGRETVGMPTVSLAFAAILTPAVAGLAVAIGAGVTWAAWRP